MNKIAWILITSVIALTSCKVKPAFHTQTAITSSLSNSVIIDKRDNEKYEVVRIKSQVWFKNNLRYHSKDSKCYGNKKKNCKFGRLYGVNNLDSICPVGWSVPNLEDWDVLKNSFGQDSIYALLDTLNWSVASNHTNESGLSLRGDGYQFGKREYIGNHQAMSIWLNQINKFDEFYHVHIYGGEGTYFKKSDYRTNEVLHAHPIENLENRRFSIRCICEKPDEINID